MNRRLSRSPFYYAPRWFLGAVKAGTLIKQKTLMNWRKHLGALLLTGDRPAIRVVRLIHRDSVWMKPTDHLGRMVHEIAARFHKPNVGTRSIVGNYCV